MSRIRSASVVSFVALVVLIAPPVLAVPGEVANLQWCAGSKTCMQWDPVPTATQYRLYRGERTSLSCVLSPSTESCDDGTFLLTTTLEAITDTPPHGSFFWFVVTASDGSSEGTPGAGTTGPRYQNASGACLPTCGVSAALCSVDADCCSASCIAGTCQTPCCQPTAAFCTTNTDCCGGSCSGGQCEAPCTAASQCPGTDTDCQVRTCTAGTCGFSYTTAGTPTGSQTPADCQTQVCDGNGGVTSVPEDSDVPDDGNQCTDGVCSGGVPSNVPSPSGTSCNQSGGTVCDGSGACVVPPQVVATTPADGASAVAGTSTVVFFNQPMDPAALAAQTSAGACSETIQVSLDDFASCIAFPPGTPTMSGGNTIASLVPKPGLLVNRTFKIRVMTSAQNASGIFLPSTFTHATGFTTTSPNPCDGSLVISQIYGAGGLTGATYRNDYVELHNRSSSSIGVSGRSIQHTGATGSTWIVTPLSGTVQAGGYYLIRLASSGAVGLALPAADAIGTADMAATTGKVALVANTGALSVSCPVGGPNVIDFVGYGTSANCNEGGTNAPSPSATTSITRSELGCVDSDINGSDYSAVAPNPRNSGSAASTCTCGIARNESNDALEADYCSVVFPASLSVPTAVSTGSILGQIYEAGVTEPGGPASTVLAQLGYGPPTANPQYQTGWTWINTTYNVQAGSNDEYQASFMAPAVGSYRYVYRFSLDQGVSWTYCDGNVGDFGAGSNTGLTFDLENQPVLTVTP